MVDGSVAGFGRSGGEGGIETRRLAALVRATLSSNEMSRLDIMARVDEFRSYIKIDEVVGGKADGDDVMWSVVLTRKLSAQPCPSSPLQFTLSRVLTLYHPIQEHFTCLSIEALLLPQIKALFISFACYNVHSKRKICSMDRQSKPQQTGTFHQGSTSALAQR